MYLFEFSNRNTRKRFEICSKLTIKTLERHHYYRSGNVIVNFEHISLLFPNVSVAKFEQVNVS